MWPGKQRLALFVTPSSPGKSKPALIVCGLPRSAFFGGTLSGFDRRRDLAIGEIKEGAWHFVLNCRWR